MRSQSFLFDEVIIIGVKQKDHFNNYVLLLLLVKLKFAKKYIINDIKIRCVYSKRIFFKKIKSLYWSCLPKKIIYFNILIVL